MRLSTLGSVAAAMATVIWMIAATYRPAGLYADPQIARPAAHAVTVGAVPFAGGR